MNLSEIAQTVGIVSELVRKPLALRHDDWQQTAYEWRVTLRYQGRTMVVQFFTGSGRVTKNGEPKRPEADDVLSSLLADASAAGSTFAFWCSDLGHDTDSRKALDTFLACQQIGAELRRLLGADYALFAEAENDV